MFSTSSSNILVNYKINEFLIFLKIKTNINSKENKENKTLEEELPSMDLIIFLFYLMMYRHKEMPFVIQSCAWSRNENAGIHPSIVFKPFISLSFTRFLFPWLIVVPLSSQEVDGVRKEKERLTAYGLE